VEKEMKQLMAGGVDEKTARKTAELIVTLEDVPAGARFDPTEGATLGEQAKRTSPVEPPKGSRWRAPSIQASTPENPGSLSNRRRGRGPY
jgi:hypothetical protein